MHVKRLTAVTVLSALTALSVLSASPAMAQTGAKAVDIVGTWKFDLKQGTKKEGPRIVIIRPDSSASYGEEIVRWRIVDDRIWIALGGEWEIYTLKVKGDRMTLSGGDLTEPILFNRTGAFTPRPEGVEVPEAPPVPKGRK